MIKAASFNGSDFLSPISNDNPINVEDIFDFKNSSCLVKDLHEESSKSIVILDESNKNINFENEFLKILDNVKIIPEKLDNNIANGFFNINSLDNSDKNIEIKETNMINKDDNIKNNKDEEIIDSNPQMQSIFYHTFYPLIINNTSFLKSSINVKNGMNFKDYNQFFPISINEVSSYTLGKNLNNHGSLQDFNITEGTLTNIINNDQLKYDIIINNNQDVQNIDQKISIVNNDFDENSLIKNLLAKNKEIFTLNRQQELIRNHQFMQDPKTDQDLKITTIIYPNDKKNLEQSPILLSEIKQSSNNFFNTFDMDNKNNFSEDSLEKDNSNDIIINTSETNRPQQDSNLDINHIKNTQESKNISKVSFQKTLDTIDSLRSVHGAKAKIQIHDERFGKIDIEIQMNQKNHVSVDIHTENQVLKQQIESDILDLKSSLSQQNIFLDQVKVIHTQSSLGSNTNGQSSGQGSDYSSQQNSYQSQFAFGHSLSQQNSNSKDEYFLNTVEQKSPAVLKLNMQNNHASQIQRSANGSIKVLA